MKATLESITGYSSRLVAVFIGITMTALIHQTIFAQSPQPQVKDKPFVVEYYYKAKWGYADEFVQLYKKNHYPLLKKEMELGRILQLKETRPRYHATEDGRWDYRVTIVWKNIQVTDDGYDEQSLIRQLFPDQDNYKKEEQRRFEILLGHWDTPVIDIDMEK